MAITPMPGFHALRPSRHCLLSLDGCHVPASALLGERDTAYKRTALPFRDIEDAVGTFSTLGALRYASSQFVGLTLGDATDSLGAVVALTAVFAAGADAVVAMLDEGRLCPGNAALVGLRLLATTLSTGYEPCCQPWKSRARPSRNSGWPRSSPIGMRHCPSPAARG
jgi:acyl-CoA dehydrogenase